MRALQRRQVRRYASRCHSTVPHLPDCTLHVRHRQAQRTRATAHPTAPAAPTHTHTHTPAQSAHLAPASRNHHCPLPSALRITSAPSRLAPARAVSLPRSIQFACPLGPRRCQPGSRSAQRPTRARALEGRQKEGSVRAPRHLPALVHRASTAPAPPSDRNTRSRQPWPRPRPPGRLPSPAFEKAARAPTPTAATHANASSPPRDCSATLRPTRASPPGTPDRTEVVPAFAFRPALRQSPPIRQESVRQSDPPLSSALPAPLVP